MMATQYSVRFLATACLLLFGSLLLWALPVRMYTAEQLSSDLISSLCQDEQGYIWIGTEYGLNKFDGVHFTQYFSDDANDRSLADDVVWHLQADRQGGVWVLTNRGVQYYNRQTDSFETVIFSDDAPAHVNDILQASDGRIWVLQATGGVVEVSADNLTARPVEAVNRHMHLEKEASTMFLDSKGRLWVAYGDSGLQMIDTRNGQTRFYDEQSLHERRAADIAEDDKHRLIVATYSAVLQLNEQTQRLETVATFNRKAVQHLFNDSRGRLLMGTSGNGLWKIDIDGRDVRPVSDVKLGGISLTGERVHAYLQDRHGNQWMGCQRRGLMMVAAKPDSFHYLPLSQMAFNNGHVLRTVFADSQNRLYVCQELGGIVSISHEGQTQAHWLANHTVTTMHEMSAGQFWVGTFRNGLFRLDTTTGREQWMPLTGTQRISSIARDRQGNLYTAVFFGGLHSYTPDGQTERTLGGGRLELTNLYLNTLLTDSDGRIWIGHYYGIDVYDPATDRLVDVGVPPTLRPAIVYAICQTADGNVWVGSNKGLFRYDTKGKQKEPWRQFTASDGLPNNMICGLVAQADGTLWVSTYRGLAQMKPDGTITRYYRGNGLKEWSYLRGVSAQSADGEVVLGHQNGITWFDPSKIITDEFSHDIVLTGMRLGNADVNSLTLSDGDPVIDGPLETASDITVSYYDNTFSLRFSSMDFREPQNVHYEYRFADEPKDAWHQTESGVSEIFFTHLAVGKHQLQVRAYDNGVYSPTKTLTLRVTPPWYRSWIAYICYLLLAAVIAVLWWRNYWNRRQAEINEDKIRLFVDLSHELRSPLTLIKGPLDQLLATEHDSTKRRALRNMERNTRRLLTLVDQILSIRKIEKGQLRLQFAETPLGEFVEDICHDFDYQAEKRGIKFGVTNEAPDMKVWIDGDHFYKVVTNLVGNAFKYVEDGGEISVVVAQGSDGHAELRVTDNGQGIDEAKLRKIFDRFYQASARPAAGQMSYGIGLNLTQKLVTMHKGTVTASNRHDGSGAEFVVQLPLGSDHLPKNSLVAATPVNVATEAIRPPVAEVDETPARRQRRKTSYRIVVVDDDEEIRQFLQTELGVYYHVKAFADGEKALKSIVGNLPDVVISDVVMPGIDGFQLLKRLKTNTATNHVPVILLTSKSDHASRIEGLEEGADAYIEKPFNLEQLEAQIAGLIANRNRLRGKFSGQQEQQGTVREIEMKGNNEALMERIMKAVNSNLDDSDFNVEALAEAAGLSRAQLHRRMKELTGQTVGEFIRNLRLQQAAKLLAKGDLSVSQITYAVGFSTPTHFSTAFKRYFGVSPSEYIAQHSEGLHIARRVQDGL